MSDLKKEDQEVVGRNFLLVRSGISFALLASVVSVQFRAPELLLSIEFRYLYFAVLISYGWLLVRYAAWGRAYFPSAASYIQALVDVVFISILVFATGGVDSVFSFMYVIIILLGSLERYMKGAMVWAMLSSAGYAMLVYLQMKGVFVLPGYGNAVIPLPRFLRTVVIHSAGFFLTGGLSGLLGEDIRKGMERLQVRDDVIRNLEMFHKNVIDNIPSGILTTDLSGTITLNNDSACLILGKPSGEFIGRPLREVLGGIDEDAEQFRYEGSAAVRPEVHFVRPDGTEIFLGFSSSQMKDPYGNIIGRVVIFQDLSPIKRMEERVRVADRLAGMGEMAAELAHEIRNPLASIAGSSQLLRESGEVPGDSTTLLEIIEQESKRLNNLISEFLSYSKANIRTVTRVRLTSLLREIVEAVRSGEGREKNLLIEDHTAKELEVEGDAEQLKQVVWNLLRNAVQSTPPGGRIIVDAFEQFRHGVLYAVLSIIDSGPGVDPQNMSKIFTPFFTTKEGGTGFGLPISQRIVHHHKGFIEARSHVGQGSVFSVFLPVPVKEPSGKVEVA
ncbi:MAG: ATP-binding protein [Syntrophorhabdaceae bacterium]|nr:ATP-binding protein [Syntrophorhabdaceae bacterium]